MYKINVLLLIVLISASAAFCQPVPVSQLPVQSYSTDPYTGDIYFAELFRSNVWKLNPKTGESSLTEFATVPAFANKSHIALYYDYSKKVCLYDFQSKTSTPLPEEIDPHYWPLGFFSPNDKKAVIGDYVYDFTTKNYYFDNKILSVPYDNRAVWTSDSSVIVKWNGALILYYPDTKRFDTLISYNPKQTIVNYSFNLSQNRLYYSTDDILSNAVDFTLYVYDMITKSSTQLYSFIKSESRSPAMYCSSMAWSPGEKILGFIGEWYTLSDADLFVYHTDSNKVFRLTDFMNNYNIKRYLQWYDNKTFYFINYYTKLLYRYDLAQNITTTEKLLEKTSGFVLSNYPNPFNNSTQISFNALERGKAELSIYNSLGQELKRFSFDELEKNIVKTVHWDGTDQNGIKVSSGIYFAILKINNERNTYSKALKLNLIK